MSTDCLTSEGGRSGGGLTRVEEGHRVVHHCLQGVKLSI
jgi:hypothetical protein